MAETLRTAAPVPGNGQFAGQDAITNVATTAHGAVDKTFVQFYPTLLPIAKDKGTLSAAYKHDESATADETH